MFDRNILCLLGLHAEQEGFELTHKDGHATIRVSICLRCHKVLSNDGLPTSE